MERESRETWAKRIERWKDSGLTAKEYATEAGVNAHSLTWWKWRLSTPPKTKAESRPRRVARGASSQAGTPVTFVELPATGAEPLEIVLPSTVRIRVPSGFDAAALRRLLEALDARR
jgi:transposase